MKDDDVSAGIISWPGGQRKTGEESTIMTGTTRIFIVKNAAIGRLHALLNRLRDNLDEIYSISLLWSDNEIYILIWTLAEDLTPTPEEIDVILRDKVLGDLSYLVKRYEA